MPPAAVSDEVAAMSEPEMVAEVRRLLRESVRKRMMSDVPFGVFLSGGLDSSTNVALMAELTDAPVRTYSTAPRGHARYDELHYARIVAAHFGTDHHEVLVDEHGDARRSSPSCVYHQDEPLVGLDGGPAALRHATRARDRDDRRAGRRGRRRALPRLPGLRRPPARRGRRSSAGCRGRSAAPMGAVAVHATSRAGRAVRHGEALYDAGHSRVPYWGGALCFRGPLKERLLRHGHHDALRDGRADLGRGRRRAARTPTCSSA